MTDEENRKNAAVRWFIFNIVGAMGAIVQLGSLFILVKFVRLDYFKATGLAVEAAILHNFFWHERWTWVERIQGEKTNFLKRLLGFNLTTGSLSMLQNLVLMKIAIEKLNMDCLTANLMIIVSCSLFNYIFLDQILFRKITKTASKEVR